MRGGARSRAQAGCERMPFGVPLAEAPIDPAPVPVRKRLRPEPLLCADRGGLLRAGRFDRLARADEPAPANTSMSTMKTTVCFRMSPVVGRHPGRLEPFRASGPSDSAIIGL